jgi:hypothetical protein
VTGEGELRLKVLPGYTPDQLREMFPIDAQIDWERDREEWEEEAAREVIERMQSQ